MFPYMHPPKGGGLYIIRLSDSHYYGGRAKNFQVRWAVHYRLFQDGRHFNPHAQSVFNIYHRFEPEVLVFLPVEEQRAKEQAWLEEHFGAPGCVNLSRSSDGVHSGYKHSETTRAKHRGPKHTPESKEKCRLAASQPRYNYTPHPHTEESRQKLSDSLRLVWAREKASGIKRKGFMGPHSNETKSSFHKTRTGKPHPHKGHPHTEDAKVQQAQKMQAWWDSLSPEKREAISNAAKGRPPTKGMTGKKHSPETKAKMAASRKAFLDKKHKGMP